MPSHQKRQVLQIIVCVALFGSVAGFLALLPPMPVPMQVPVPSSVSPYKPVAFQAKVISVTDGDTIVVRTLDSTLKIRLAQIDAPELGQPWGQKSRQTLIGFVGRKTINVMPRGYDRYGRTIADLSVGGRAINQDMVARGAAWAYRDYLRDPQIVGLEADARSQGNGLWALPVGQRMAPWAYRAQRRQAPTVMVGR